MGELDQAIKVVKELRDIVRARVERCVKGNSMWLQYEDGGWSSTTIDAYDSVLKKLEELRDAVAEAQEGGVMTDLEFIEERGDTLSFSRGDLQVVLDVCHAEDKWFAVMAYRFDGDYYSQTTEDRFGKFEEAWACVRRLFEREE